MANKAWSLSDAEQKMYDDWRAKHVCPAAHNPFDSDSPRPSSPIGGGAKWIITPTAVGDEFDYVCHCGEEVNCTDYESW